MVALRTSATVSCPVSCGAQSRICFSSSTLQRRQVPRHRNAGPFFLHSSGLGGKVSQEPTSMLHAATPSLPRRNTSIDSATAAGGANAGWNAGNLSLQSSHSNTTRFDMIACIACTARRDASRKRTSYFTARTGTFLAGTPVYWSNMRLAKSQLFFVPAVFLDSRARVARGTTR